MRRRELIDEVVKRAASGELVARGVVRSRSGGAAEVAVRVRVELAAALGARGVVDLERVVAAWPGAV